MARANIRPVAKARLLIVRWGELRVHDLNLAHALTKHYQIDIAVFSPHYAYRGIRGRELIKDAARTFRVFECKAGVLTRQLMRVCRLGEWAFGTSFPMMLVGIQFPYRIRRLVRANRYAAIIPIEQYALYCVWHGVSGPSPIIYYSLEAQRASDDDMTSNLRTLLVEERKILPQLDGVIIQDRARLDVIGDNLAALLPKVYYVPLFSLRPQHCGQSNFLRMKLKIEQGRQIVLYYGAFYEERFIWAIAEAFRAARRDDMTIVLHNPQMSAHEETRLDRMGACVRPSTVYLNADELDDMVASADVGIALYDNNKPNTRLTAYSSEKVVTYLRCGIPFIAFDNESYRHLKSNYDCCALIESIDNIVEAVDVLMQNLEHHANEARRAYCEIFHRTELRL